MADEMPLPDATAPVAAASKKDDAMTNETEYAARDRSNNRAPPMQVTPETLAADIRARIKFLRIEIQHIEDQLANANLLLQHQNHAYDPDWWRRARDSIRHKQVEIVELERELDLRPERMLRAIIDAVKPDYTPEEWEDVEDEARSKLKLAA